MEAVRRAGGGASPAAAVGWGLLGVLVALSLLLALRSPAYGLAVPAAALGAGLVLLLSRVPLGQLCGVLVLFGVTARLKDGIQVEEVVFAAYYLGFLAHWFATRLWVYREPVFKTAVDVTVGAFLVYMTASLGLTVLFGGRLALAQSDWINFSTLAFYFPMKEACARYRLGPWVVVGIVLYLGLFSVTRNTLMLSSAFGDAEYAWEIARGRVAMGEMMLLVPALGCLVFAVRERALWSRLLLTAGFALFSAGVIMTQWRAYYVDLAVGVVVLFLLVGWRQRGRLLGLTSLSVVVGLGLAYAVFGDFVELLVLGILDRALSIGTATSADISLLNRFVENRAVYEAIWRNPIVGYGLGTTFAFYDTIYNATWVKPYVHNGYLMLWFKFGIVGLGAVLFVWFRSITAAWGVWRSQGRPEWERTLGLTATVTLISLLPSHAISATFSTSDTVMMFAILTGTAMGLVERAER